MVSRAAGVKTLGRTAGQKTPRGSEDIKQAQATDAGAHRTKSRQSRSLSKGRTKTKGGSEGKTRGGKHG
ncbi:MAG: hypothetical protein A2Y07_03500 [Planctomycetes bacterium GWF2_50_10]|nr:MAG: hypothetical protein A2Y07_03500 [Planctomycetes bacterium GWF2_50_10]